MATGDTACSSAREGKGWGEKISVPGVVMLWVEPKGRVLSTFLAARYTQERWARLKGISSRSMA